MHGLLGVQQESLTLKLGVRLCESSSGLLDSQHKRAGQVCSLYRVTQVNFKYKVNILFTRNTSVVNTFLHLLSVPNKKLSFGIGAD